MSPVFLTVLAVSSAFYVSAMLAHVLKFRLRRNPDQAGAEGQLPTDWAQVRMEGNTSKGE